MGVGRIAAVSLLIAAIACTTISVVLDAKLEVARDQRDAATATARGKVIEDYIGSDEDIRVRWVDRAGTERVTRFGIYDVDKYEEGASFAVKYNPDAPNDRAFPADKEETLLTDDLEVGLFLPWALVVILAVWWIIRYVRGARWGGRPHKPAPIAVLSGSGPVAGITRTTWIRFEENGETRVQRVHWHPQLSSVRRGELGQVATRRGITGVRLTNGTQLTSIGRTDVIEDRGELQDLGAVRTSLADSFVGRPITAHDGWLRTLCLRAAYGAIFGAGIGVLVVGSTTMGWILGLMCAALAVNLWALYGADR